MRSVTYRTEDLQRAKLTLGFVGENLHTRFIFDCRKDFGDYPSAVPALTVQPPEGEPYPAVITRDGDMVYWDVKDSDLINQGDGEIQLAFVQGEVIERTYIGKTVVLRSIIPTGEIPDPLDDFLVEASAALTAIPQTILDALAAAKASGEFDGADGVGIQSIAKTATVGLEDTYTITLTDGRTYSYTVTNGAKGDTGVGIQSISKTGTSGLVDTYTITYTNGQTTTFTVTNGAPGDDGYSPTASVIKSGKVTTITITDKNGTTSEEILDGADGSDVIDDTAGAGDTDKTFSADKLTADHTAVMNALTQSSENTNIAISAHAIGDLFWYNGTLHVATSAIAVGDTIVDTGSGANCKDTTINEALIKDIQINGTSILQNGVANVPIASASEFGAVKIGAVNDYLGIEINNSGKLKIVAASIDQMKSGQASFLPIVPVYQHVSTFYALAKAAGADMKNVTGATVGTYPEDQKSAISQMLNGAVQVTGTTPVIVAKPGIPYRCGECATLDITAPSSGIVDVVFESGSTPTVLTVTSAKANTTIKWVGDFDPSSLEANTQYEINVMDGEWGMAVSWT